jgi:hypothetical protein
MNPMAFDPFTLRQLIKEHGISATLRKRSESAYDNNTGTVTATNTDYTVKAYYYEFTPDMLDGQSVVRGDKRVVLDIYLTNGSATPKPDTTDQIIGYGKTSDIIDVSEIKSSSNVMCYLLQVRN